MAERLVGYLRAPDLDIDEETARAFDELLARAADNGGDIEYDRDEPKHVFLQYLAQRRGLMLHGTNDHDIDEFEPRPNDDYMGRPGVRVYATCDGIWPMYFAVTDRNEFKGSMWNAAFRAREPDGSERVYYRFSISRESRERKDAWSDGSVYVLPRESFDQVRAHDGTPLEEWASEQPVRPLAKLRVSPEDFPFLDEVATHETADIDRLNDLVTKVLAARVDDLEELDDGYALCFQPDEDLMDSIFDLALLLWRYQPFGVGIDCGPDRGEVRVRLSGPHPAKQLISFELANIASGNSGGEVPGPSHTLRA